MTDKVNGTQTFAHLDVTRGVGMLGSEAALRNILVTVLTSLSADVPTIGAALRTGDVVTVSRLLHAIKGYIPIFGRDVLVEQVVTVEKLSKTEPIAVVQGLYLQLEPDLQRLLVEIRLFLSDGP
jgi:hypothetical protein